MNQKRENIKFDIEFDIKGERDKKYANDLTHGTKLGLTKLLFHEKGCYIGDSKNANNLPFQVSFQIAGQELARTNVRGIPLPNQEWRESENINFEGELEVNMPKHLTCDIQCDIDGKDKKVYNDIKNGTSLDLAKIGKYSGRNLYIGDVKYKIDFVDKAKPEVVVGSVEVKTSRSGDQKWRESHNVNFFKEPSQDKLLCRMPELITCDIEYDIDNGGKDIKLYNNVYNGKEVSYEKLTRHGVKDKRWPRKDTHYRGVYIGDSSGEFKFEIKLPRNNITVAHTTVKCSPLNSQKWRESHNLNFEDVTIHVNLYEDIIDETVKQHAPYIEFSDDEKYYPSDIEYILNKVNLYDKDENETLLTNFDLISEGNSNKYIGWKHLDNYQKSGLKHFRKIYVVINRNDDNLIEITYHFFYPFNGSSDFPDPFVKGMNHYGDWERFAVKIHKKNKNKKESSYLFYHHSDITTKGTTKVENVDGHPKLYVAAETHAGFWSAWPPNKIAEDIGGGLELHTFNKLEIVTDYNGATKENSKWIDWKGNWGGENKHTIKFHRNWSEPK